MKISFEDPNIKSMDSFMINGVNVSAPIFSVDEIQNIIDSTNQETETFFSTSDSAFNDIGNTFSKWTNPSYKLRHTAIPILSKITQFSEPNILCFGLNPLNNLDFEAGQFNELPEQLISKIETENYKKFTPWDNGYLKGFGTPQVTKFAKPRKVLQILAGNIVGPTWFSVCLGAITQSAQIIKLPNRDLASFMYFLNTLDEISPDFRKTIACGYYSKSDPVNDYLLKESDLVIAMGSDESMHEIKNKLMLLNQSTRFIQHGLKISFQVISKNYATKEVADLAAWGVSAYDGNGCFSPVNIFIERGGTLSPVQFADQLAFSMETIAEKIPPKETMQVAERINNYRNQQVQRKLLGEDINILKSENTDYTIVIDNEKQLLTPTCQERTVIVKPIGDIRDIPKMVGHLSKNLQTVGLAVPSSDIVEIANNLGNVGATTFKIIGTEFSIDLKEPHDGIFDTVQMYMSDNLRWTSISFSDTDKAIDRALSEKSDCLSNL